MTKFGLITRLLYVQTNSDFGVKIYLILDPKKPCIPRGLNRWPTLVDRFTYEVLRADIFPLSVFDSLCLMRSVRSESFSPRFKIPRKVSSITDCEVWRVTVNMLYV